MITKGEILSIDYNGNTCSVRLPIFETAGNKFPTIVNGIFSIQPGVYNGYKVGDIVEVGFEDHEVHNAVILGKLYLGANAEKDNNGGSIHCQTITVAKDISLPLDTKITSDTINEVATVAGTKSTYKTLGDVLDALKAVETKAGNLPTYSTTNEIEVGTWIDGKTIYRKIFNVVISEKPTVGTYLLGEFDFEISDVMLISYTLTRESTVNTNIIDVYITKNTSPQKSTIKTSSATQLEKDDKLIITVDYTRK